jgi:hypothetical protein
LIVWSPRMVGVKHVPVICCEMGICCQMGKSE